YGPNAGRMHDYNAASLAQLDQALAALNARGVQAVIQLRSQPRWASGSTGDVTAAGGPPSNGQILTAYKDLFRANFADLAYFLAGRYPHVRDWAIGNEINLDYYFSPQPPLAGNSPAVEYMNLMFEPAAGAIRSLNPEAVVFGAELFTCYNTGAACPNLDHNWNVTTNWLTDWAEVLLTGFPECFPRFSIHNYSDSDEGVLSALAALEQRMNCIGVVRPIWITEFNFRSGTCKNTAEDIATWTSRVYSRMNCERAFYFDLNSNGCFSLLDAQGQPKPTLYRAFQSMVSSAG
ncbi:MAG: hypothetical protein IT162_18210, partial [Bryobacterales bacterium]|nr:hypothetical protein [Bryobacterales bacterium]